MRGRRRLAEFDLRPGRAEEAGEAGSFLTRHGVPGWEAPQTAAPYALWIGRRMSEPMLAGVLLGRVMADEAEVLALAVREDLRRKGLARLLLRHWTATLPARLVHLEVSAENVAAIALYRGIGFTDTGRRPGYYLAGSRRIDALVMSCSLPLR